MPYSVVLKSEGTAQYVEAHYIGAVTPHELGAAADEIMSYLRQVKPLRLLADCTGVNGGHSVADLHALANWLAEDPDRRKIREALVQPTGGPSAADVEFWEKTCVNRGLNVRAFKDRSAALAWLLV